METSRPKVEVADDGTCSIRYTATFSPSDDEVILMSDILASGKAATAAKIPWIKAMRTAHSGLRLYEAKIVSDYLLEALTFGDIVVERSPKVTYKAKPLKEAVDSRCDQAQRSWMVTDCDDKIVATRQPHSEAVRIWEDLICDEVHHHNSDGCLSTVVGMGSIHGSKLLAEQGFDKFFGNALEA